MEAGTEHSSSLGEADGVKLVLIRNRADPMLVLTLSGGGQIMLGFGPIGLAKSQPS